MARPALLYLSIIAILSAQPHLCAQSVPGEAPPAASSLPAEPSPQPDALAALPRATPLPPDRTPDHAVLESDTQTKVDDTYTLTGDVEIDYRDHVLRADRITYNADTGDVSAEGHVHLTGGENDESIQASHGTYNIRTQTGRFYDVDGSVQVRTLSDVSTPPRVNTNVIAASSTPRQGYLNSNPFLFRGRMVVKTGPQDYIVYDGSVTSCLLPRPDWQLFGRRFILSDGKARAAVSTFRLMGIPVLFLPYVTHPVDSAQRQSGILIPVLGYSSASQNTGSKGTTIGEQAYLTLGRSADLTIGTLYYSLRGFSENGTFRYRGSGDDFLTAHFSALQDRGFSSPSVDARGKPITIYTNQGGEDVTGGFRRQLSTHTRVVADAEYLSSYIYRQAFTENFNQAVSSDILSTIYATRQADGFSLDARADRYQGLKRVPINNSAGQEVKIFHAPSIDFTAVDHAIPRTPLLWSVAASSTGLKRVQPNFTTSGIIERVDLRPELALPLAFAGWHILSSVAFEDTAYTRSRQAPYGNGAVPVELVQGLNRADVDLRVDIRPPVVERTFTVPQRWRWLLGPEVRHTIEGRVVYRDVKGVNNFLSVLRFDDTDLVSNTNELQYGATQHLYFRPRSKAAKLPPGCAAAAPPDHTQTPEEPDPRDVLNPTEEGSVDANGIPNSSVMVPDAPTRTRARRKDPCAPAAGEPAQQEWFTWTVTQKLFFDQLFGGAVIDERRNIFDTTLALSGIAFLTEPRSISPVISRMRFRSSSHTDVGWDFDYDTGASKFTSSNVYLDVHEGRLFGGFSYAGLNAPGRFYTEVINTTNNTTGLTTSATSNFSQMRLLLGYGTPSRTGLAAAAGAGVDLKLDSAQYITLQTSYNWNCCGLTIEYRKYNLGTVRDDGTYRFNFTLANIGSAGNLRRTEALF